MSSLVQDVRIKMMNILKSEEGKTDLENLSVLSRVGMKVASSASYELDADAISASSTALIDLGLRLSEATAHGALTDIILRNSSGYSILSAINDDYIIFGGLKNQFRIGYYLGYLRELAKKMNILISGDEITEMTLTLEESEREKLLKQQEEAEELRVSTPSVEQDKAALDDLLGFLDDWEKEGVEFEDLEAGNESNIVSIPKSVGLAYQKEMAELTEEQIQETTSKVLEEPISSVPSGFMVYEDEVPPIPLDDYTPMEIEEDASVQSPEIVQESSYPAQETDIQEPISPEELPSLDDLVPPDFITEFNEPATEYDTEFVLGEESEALESVLKDLGWDEIED